MKTKSFLLLLMIIISSLFACKNNLITNISNKDPKILAHRGSGTIMQIIGKDTIIENTIAAAKYGFDNFDGIEIDIQMSKSGTIWLYHNSDLYNNDTQKCILNSTDEEIITLNKDLPKWKQLCTLEDVFVYHSLLNKDKYISLDVKGYFNATCLEGRNISNEYQQNIADEIIRLAKKYKLENSVMIETDYKEVLDHITDNYDTLKCYFLAYRDFNKKLQEAIDCNYDGLSFSIKDTSLNKANIKKLHNKGLTIQIWTIRNNKEKQKALDLGADFIQSDVIF